MPGYGAGNSLPFLYSDFHGGLNTKDQPYLLTDDESRDLQNVQGTTAGAIVKRTGLVTFATLAATLTSLVACEETASSFLVGAGSTFLYSIATDGTVTQIAAGLTSNRRWEFVSAPTIAGQGPLYGLNGIDTPQQWTGVGSTTAWTATDAGGAVPNGTFCIYSGNQVFIAGDPTHPSRVYWSAIADPTGWNPANDLGAGFEDFDPGDGQAITGLGRVGPYVLVTKPRKLFILVDTASATVRRLAENVGCIAHRSIAEGSEGTYFLAEDRGIYLTNGSKLTPISDKIQPTIDSTQAGLRAQASGTYFNAHYYLSLPVNSTSNDTTLDWDATLGSWWKHSFGSNQYAVWHPAAAADLFSAKGTSAIVDQCFVSGVTVDNGTAFTWRWAGPWQSPTFYRRRRFPTPYFRKRLRQVRFDGAGTVDFSLAKDFTISETLIASDAFGAAATLTEWEDVNGVWGVDDGTAWGDTPMLTRARFHTLGVANAFSLVFSATSTTSDVLTSYTMMVSDRKDLVVS